jgi:hypothetical protein
MTFGVRGARRKILNRVKEALQEFIAAIGSKPYTSAALTKRIFQQAIRTDMNDDLPTVIIEEVEARSAADVVEIIHLHNGTDRTYVAKVRADFWITVDDDTGAALHHGFAGTEVELAPGERAQIGDIVGWEWDSVLGLDIEFRHPEGNGPRRVSYDLARGRSLRHVDGLGEVCEVAPRKTL